MPKPYEALQMGATGTSLPSDELSKPLSTGLPNTTQPDTIPSELHIQL